MRPMKIKMPTWMKIIFGRMNEANRVVMKDYALYNCMSEMARNNHLNNEIYIHDLDSMCRYA